MKKLYFLLGMLFLLSIIACSQQTNTITGDFPSLAGQKILLQGFNGFDTYVIDSTEVNAKGIFKLKYDADISGVGQLSAEDNKPFVLILDDELIIIEGESFANAASIKQIEGRQNKLFEQYASEHLRREQALSAWDYLERIYTQDSLFINQHTPQKAIEQEKKRIKTEDKAFLDGLNPNDYVNWYLPMRKLVSSVGTIAQYRTHQIPETIEAFRSLDYTDDRLWASGLLVQTIESHFWLIENSGRPLDSVYIEMGVSIDHMVNHLLADETKLNEVTENLFKLLESRSLFGASEYLALKLLNEQGCTLNNDLAAQLESYRAMKKGNNAPDFELAGELFTGINSDNPNKLSDVNSNYKVLLFGASWCQKCVEELSLLQQLYPNWKKHGVEVVFISLDEQEQAFSDFADNSPFISVCDYQKWDSPIVKSYHVFATPTMYLLDSKNEILLRPNSVKHMDSWVDWFLVKGNSF
jgi:peroxiredoxin